MGIFSHFSSKFRPFRKSPQLTLHFPDLRTFWRQIACEKTTIFWLYLFDYSVFIQFFNVFANEIGKSSDVFRSFGGVLQKTDKTGGNPLPEGSLLFHSFTQKSAVKWWKIHSSPKPNKPNNPINPTIVSRRRINTKSPNHFPILSLRGACRMRTAKQSH